MNDCLGRKNRTKSILGAHMRAVTCSEKYAENFFDRFVHV